MQLLMISDSPLSSSTSSLTNAIYHVKECKLPYKKFWCIMLLSLYKNLVLFVNRLKQIDNADTRMSSCPQKLYWTCEFSKNRSFIHLSLEWRKKAEPYSYWGIPFYKVFNNRWDMCNHLCITIFLHSYLKSSVTEADRIIVLETSSTIINSL